MLKLITERRPTDHRGAAPVGVVLLMGALMFVTLAAPACHAWALADTDTDRPKAGDAAGMLVAQERGEETEAPAERYLRLEDELVRKGEEAFAAEDYVLAEQVFRSLVQHNPEDLRGFLGLGKVHYANKQYSTAAGAYFDALRLDRNNVPALLGLGKINVALFKWDQAFEFFQEVAEIDEENAEAERYINNLLHGRFGEEESLPAEYYRIMLSPAITRGELAALLYVRSFGLQTITSEPETQIMTDISDNWARPYILEVTKHGIMSVFPNHTFLPKTVVTRGEFAQVLHNLLQKVGLKEAYQGGPVEGAFVADVDPSNRYYQAIRAMCTFGIMAPVAGSAFNPSDLVAGSQAVEAFNRLEAVANLPPSTELPAPSAPQ